MDAASLPFPQQPPEGQMVIAVLGDDMVKPIPQRWMSPNSAPMQGIIEAVASAFGPYARVETVPHFEFPDHHTVHYRNGAFTFIPVVQPPRELAPLNVDDVVELITHFSSDKVQVAPLDHPDEADERDDLINKLREDLDAEKARADDLARQLEEARAETPTPLPPDPSSAKLSEYGEVGPGDETDWLGVPGWLAAEERDGESMDERISRLTEAFRARVNELTNLLLAGTITEEEDRERTLLLAKYNELAELGDRS